MAQTKEGAIISAAKLIGISVDEYKELSINNKRCTKCKSWQHRDSFNKDTTRGDGLSTKCHNCIRVKVKKSHKGRVSTFKGHTHTEASKTLMREAQSGKPSPMEGRTHTIESRKQMSVSRRNSTTIPRGDKCHSYKDGKLQERRGQRFTKEYKQWRYDVFLRDKFTCQKCGNNKGGNLNAHHIKPFADFPELRFDIGNGITLCKPCHKLEH